ncbi:hypothetical protein AJ78_00735 [Emergomyces pasteurianus Ep9510]|uniref:Uncharacterized protein n=1 Tax=Emergomyces pasteurianus Ep9510 TaxID=1447872 RepID=A0A1J9PSQ1_9EURO|nr:hypothetical protein AJ78_00735 [Emergomyces pasteurianus Ep9510]
MPGAQLTSYTTTDRCGCWYEHEWVAQVVVHCTRFSTERLELERERRLGKDKKWILDTKEGFHRFNKLMAKTGYSEIPYRRKDKLDLVHTIHRSAKILEDVEVANSSSPEGMTSLTTLLDVVDDVEGDKVFIMTTCHFEPVDATLFRAERVHVKAEFCLAD